MVIGVHSTCWEETMPNNEKCSFPAINVLEETLKCQESNKVVYQGRIIGTKRTTPGIIIDYINKWILLSNDDSIAITIEDDDNTYTLSVDKTCPPYLASPLDSNCTPEVNNVNTTLDVLSLMAIVAMSAVMTMLIVAHFINALKHTEINSINYACNYNYKLNKY